MPTYGYREQSHPPGFLRFVKHRKLFIMIGVAALAVLYITLSNKGLWRRVMLEREIDERTYRVEQLKIELDSLQLVRNKLKYDKATIEHVAREEHGMIKPGEVVYRVRPVGSATE